MVETSIRSDDEFIAALSAVAAAQGTGRTLVERLVDYVAAGVRRGTLRPGQRLLSVRRLAQRAGVSLSTAAAVCERMVVLGHAEARRGAGYFVRQAASKEPSQVLRTLASRTIDSAWLARSLRDVSRIEARPGTGSLPADWIEPGLTEAALRSLGRQSMASATSYGDPFGWPGLRSQLRVKLAEIQVQATPEQIVTTSGATHGMEIVIGRVLQAGDAVLVDDPGWFVLFEKLRARRIRMLAVPWTEEGPDLAAVESWARVHRPKLMITQSVRHNPTGGTIAPAVAHKLLILAEVFDFLIVEDDVWADIADPATSRLATLDQLRRVIYLGSFSKSLQAGLRVGFLACSPDLADGFVDHKLVLALTTSEINERLVQHILGGGQYRRHVGALRSRLDRARDLALPQLEAGGLRLGPWPSDGPFAWVETGVDTQRLAERAAAVGIVLAPGALFNPSLEPSSRMRVNVAACTSAAACAALMRLFGSV